MIQTIYNIHQSKENDLNSICYRRLAYDEILSNLLVLSQVRKRVKKIKKKAKKFNNFLSQKIIKKLSFSLTGGQKKIIEEINSDLNSDFKMFRLLQGDVGSGKTIVALIAAANVISSKYQVAIMAPTEILAKQHYELAKKTFRFSNIKIQFLTGKSDQRDKKNIQQEAKSGKVNLLIGTHALFQKSIFFKNLGLVIMCGL